MYRFLQKRRQKTETIYLDEGLLMLNDMFKLEMAKFCFKFKSGLLPNALNDILTSNANIHNHQTRSASKNFFIQVNCNNKELRHIAPEVWSKVPDDLKEENSLSSFCTKLKIELMKDYCG